VSSGILLDDRITCVPWLTVEYQVKKTTGLLGGIAFNSLDTPSTRGHPMNAQL
jgi:hypothetical protein